MVPTPVAEAAAPLPRYEDVHVSEDAASAAAEAKRLRPIAKRVAVVRGKETAPAWGDGTHVVDLLGAKVEAGES